MGVATSRARNVKHRRRWRLGDREKRRRGCPKMGSGVSATGAQDSCGRKVRFLHGRRDLRRQASGMLKVTRTRSPNSKTYYFRRVAKVRICPHPHSKFVRCSASQSSLSPKMISRSPHPHSKVRRPELATVSSDSLEPSIYLPLPLALLSERVIPAARRGEMRCRRLLLYPQARLGHAFADCPLRQSA